MPAAARKGDPGSHGGAILTGSPDATWDGIPAARVGDTYGCPLHGPNAIIQGSPDTYVNDRRAARVGDATACGAVIAAGSPTTFIND